MSAETAVIQKDQEGDWEKFDPVKEIQAWSKTKSQKSKETMNIRDVCLQLVFGEYVDIEEYEKLQKKIFNHKHFLELADEDEENFQSENENPSGNTKLNLDGFFDYVCRVLKKYVRFIFSPPTKQQGEIYDVKKVGKYKKSAIALLCTYENENKRNIVKIQKVDAKKWEFYEQNRDQESGDAGGVES